MGQLTLRHQPSVPSPGLIALAWVVTLYTSELSTVLWRELVGPVPPWLLWSKLVLLAALAVASLFWRTLRPLRNYFLLFLVIYATTAASAWLIDSAWWQGRFGAADAPFALSMLGEQLRRLSIALVVIAALLLLRYRRADIFLVKGNLAATGAPIRWLGIMRPFSYRRFGPLAALCICLGLGAFMVIGGGWPQVSPGSLSPLTVAAVIVLAAMNAFYENVTYRAAPLATLEPAVGPGQAMLLTAFVFGIGHYYGVPYGIVGAVMAGALGWILNKTMLETRGFFWPWFIHFCQDALIFSFMAVGAVAAGG